MASKRSRSSLLRPFGMPCQPFDLAYWKTHEPAPSLGIVRIPLKEPESTGTSHGNTTGPQDKPNFPLDKKLEDSFQEGNPNRGKKCLTPRRKGGSIWTPRLNIMLYPLERKFKKRAENI